MAGKVNFTHSDLLRSRDPESAGLCQNIRTSAADVLASLGDYKVTTTDLTDLAQKISTYETALAVPADARVAKKRATDNIDAAFVDFDDILESRMDRLIPKFQSISPDFVKDYWNARNIVDLGGGRATGGNNPPTPAPTPVSPGK